MGIWLDREVVADEQGFPVVTWEEDRNLMAPGGIGRVRVACFIRPDADGVLQFVAVGSVRHGAFVEARPWESLVSFKVDTADQHYYAASDRAMLEMLANKSKSGLGRWIITDGAHVMLASFADKNASVPMHLNCADCAPVEATLLHDRLHQEFIVKRRYLVNEFCGGEFRWPKAKPPFKAYEPTPQATVPPRMVRAMDASIVAAFGLIGFGLYWWLLR